MAAIAGTVPGCFAIDGDDGPAQVGGLRTDRFAARDGQGSIAPREFELRYWAHLSNWSATAGSVNARSVIDHQTLLSNNCR
ncbi:hypothetical protein AB0O01_32155 [Streptomyces sp. NPDC093252]|uniref:hypothetical protein n=1 Tax=Streptomyces sp. NPDC093252 TaxID=3154980 RepID=UPI0034489231